MATPTEFTDRQLDSISAGIEFTITNRVSDQVGVAPVTDAKAVNVWGLSSSPTGPLWTANNGTDSSTLYGAANFAKIPLEVNVPGGPTGTTFVGIGGSFNITDGTKTGSTAFAFATESGKIEGWSPGVNLTNALVAVDEASSGAVFKGLTLAGTGSGARLFAADFANAVVRMYDSSYGKAGTFTDPNLPSGYSPFNVQTLNGEIYVAYAKHAPGSGDEVAGKGLGIVDVFDSTGKLTRRLVDAGGKLDAPWGLAIAPAKFGKFAGALLVGNFGNGQINAFDPQTGKYLGALKGDDERVTIDGLWALRTGPNGTITFSAGPAGETHGLIGSIDVRAPGFDADEMASVTEMHGHH
jgi:uncharacterized protein (TIGR03118 family)